MYNQRPEQLLREVQALRGKVHDLNTGFKAMMFLAVTGWVLVVVLLAMVPA